MSSQSNGSSQAPVGLGNTANAGTAGIGNNPSQFNIPTGSADPNSGLNGLNMGGLVGAQGGMTISAPSATVGNYSFTMPNPGTGQGSTSNSGAPTPFGFGSQLSSPKPNQPIQGSPGGKVRLPAQTFTIPLTNEATQSGSQAGNSLIGMLQKYRVGNGT